VRIIEIEDLTARNKLFARLSTILESDIQVIICVICAIRYLILGTKYINIDNDI